MLLLFVNGAGPLMPTRCRALLPADAGGAFVTSQTQIPRALRSTVCFADGIFVNGAGPLMPTRCRAPLPADAGGAFVNGLRKTNVCFRSRLFFAALIISYTHESRADALYCLLAQAIRSLMACEKQMSAAQPLVFPCAHYIIVSSFRLSVFP